MRISDWSSDVCSSDLWRCQAAREDAEIPRLELEHDRARHAFGLACGGPGLFRKAADVRCQHRQWQILGEGVLGGHGLGRPVRQHAVFVNAMRKLGQPTTETAKA